MQAAPTTAVRYPLSRLEFVVEAVAAVGLILAFVIPWANWSALPENIPVHYNFRGEPDAWGARSTLIILPLISVILYALISLITLFIIPRRAIADDKAGLKIARAACVRRMMIFLKAEIIWMFLFIDWQTIRVANNSADGLGSLSSPVALGVIFFTIIYYMLSAARVR